MSHYHHLSIDERESILVMKEKGYGQSEIAAQLKRNPSTISRELNRNAEQYSPHAAQEAYKARRPRRLLRFADASLREKVEQLLMKFWSPEQIAERLRLEGAAFVSYSTIYRALASGCLNPALRRKLRIKYKPYRKGHKGRTGRIPVDHWIDERPKTVNNRKDFGHWESDTLLGKAGGVALATHVERKSRYTVAAFIPQKKAADYTAATIKLMKPLPSDLVKSFTVDHGKEFAKHRAIRDALQATVYFAHPNCPGERGTNENTNGLLRQWLPKSSDFSAFSPDFLRNVLDLLNRRPRKCLAWRSPYEIFFNKPLHFT